MQIQNQTQPTVRWRGILAYRITTLSAIMSVAAELPVPSSDLTLIGHALPSSGVLCYTVWLRWRREDAKPEKIRQGSSHRKNPIPS
jgi:hypothetical protein